MSFVAFLGIFLNISCTTDLSGEKRGYCAYSYICSRNFNFNFLTVCSIENSAACYSVGHIIDGGTNVPLRTNATCPVQGELHPNMWFNVTIQFRWIQARVRKFRIHDVFICPKQIFKITVYSKKFNNCPVMRKQINAIHNNSLNNAVKKSGFRLKNLLKDSSSLRDRTKYFMKVSHVAKCKC